MIGFEKFKTPNGEKKDDSEQLSREEIKELTKNLNTELSEKEKINFDKMRKAEEELIEERGKSFEEMDPKLAAVEIEKRVEENDKKIKREIDEMAS